jgi:hypothetical protein
MQYPFVEKKSYRQSLRIAIGYFQAADIDLVTTDFVSLIKVIQKNTRKINVSLHTSGVYRKVVQRDVLRHD